MGQVYVRAGPNPNQPNLTRLAPIWVNQTYVLYDCLTINRNAIPRKSRVVQEVQSPATGYIDPKKCYVRLRCYVSRRFLNNISPPGFGNLGLDHRCLLVLKWVLDLSNLGRGGGSIEALGAEGVLPRE